MKHLFPGANGPLPAGIVRPDRRIERLRQAFVESRAVCVMAVEEGGSFGAARGRGSSCGACLRDEAHGEGSRMSYAQWRRHVLNAMAASDMSWFAVLDPAASRDLPGLLWTVEKEPMAWPLLPDAVPREVAVRGPLFVRLMPNGELAQWFLDGAGEHALGLVCAVKRGGEGGLFRHFRRLLAWEHPAAGPCLLRVHDPRVLHALCRFRDPQWALCVPGPAAMLFAWEPGRAEPVFLCGKAGCEPAHLAGGAIPHDIIAYLAGHNP